MVHAFPPEPRFPDDGGAERAVFEALCAQLPDGVAVFHGVHLQEDEQEYEIDLVVAWPGVGVATIEVKGGHIERAGGTWYQGNGVNRHRIDPVAQVQGARHALQALMRERGALAASPRTAHLVAFPHRYVPGTWEALDLSHEMPCRDCRTGISVRVMDIAPACMHTGRLGSEGRVRRPFPQRGTP